ncbi:GSK3B-interacting protein-like [Saccoglossus kowalevskii]|uniref:GSK3-beta interaction protein-like n=1 Tax=Saccoglossus kowalevskii TaxID=10224 RepID=A0ABM0MED3_SACKO|nr:PREDICTED: GSK3-beta interaction protein-like [Saccoglossus kowalevskii]
MTDGDTNCKLMTIEAESAVQEVAFAVKSVSISEFLPKGDELVYLNIQTKEDDVYCVELSVLGFGVVGRRFDTIDDSLPTTYYETIYALLDKLSPGYRLTFGETLAGKLQMLQQNDAEKSDTKELETKMS